MEFPQNVKIVEVGPRDGFQNIKEWISTDLKLEIIDKLVKSNFKKIEITSFAHPKAIPQMKDAKEVVKNVLQKYKDYDVEFNALVPNLYGAKAAWESGIREITYVISSSEAHNKANVNRTIEESFKELKTLKKELPDMKIKLDIATAFGCPFLGDIPVKQVVKLIQESIELQIDDVCLCDTIGIANPLQMQNALSEIKTVLPNKEFSLHLHDTRGMGLANTLAAMECGISVFESAVGGLGGCLFAPGAAGNTASEDLVFMMNSMNINTGIYLYKLLDAVKLVKKQIKPDLTSHLVYVDNPFLNKKD